MEILKKLVRIYVNDLDSCTRGTAPYFGTWEGVKRLFTPRVGNHLHSPHIEN